jgi:hypothetical protein
MDKIDLLSKMVVVADYCDGNGFEKEAESLDNIMVKVAWRAPYVDAVADNIIKAIKKWIENNIDADDFLLKPEDIDVRDLVIRIVKHIDVYLKRKHDSFIKLKLTVSERSYVEDVIRK